MGSLAIRQGDVLFFARSIVWKTTIMVTNDLKNQPEHVRMAEFYKLWDAHKRAGNFDVSQESADRLAALCHVAAPKVKRPIYTPAPPDKDRGNMY